MKILYTAFNGKQNSSKVLLDKISSNSKLYLRNSFITSVTQLEKELRKNYYDLIISFGQAPLGVDTVKIEEIGCSYVKYKTVYDYIKIKSDLESKGYKVIISNDAGAYLCNNLYFHGLKYIDDNSLRTKMLFIHIPEINCITNISELANIFTEKF